MTQRPHTSRRQGQTFLLVILMTLVLSFLFVTAFDIFLVTRNKVRLINAGDAGALAAARWQGITLNIAGELNLVHLAAACDTALDGADRTNIIDGVNALAERIAFAGPIQGLYAANRAVEENARANTLGSQSPAADDDLAAILEQEISACSAISDTALWTGKGNDYAQMLRAVLHAGVYAGCDNARLISSGQTGNHLYYVRAFYEAARSTSSRRWFCQYYGYDHSRAISMLRNFNPPSPDDLIYAGNYSPFNAGFFGAGLDRSSQPLASITVDPESALLQMWDSYIGGPPVDAVTLNESGAIWDMRFPWIVLAADGTWRAWRELAQDTTNRRALVAPVQPRYDVYGAQAAVRVARDMGTLAGDTTNNVAWMAAARPFGSLPNDARVTDLFAAWDGQSENDQPLVMPAFSFTRLIALGGVGAGNLYKADLSWLEHLTHLHHCYRVPNCARCNILNYWEKQGASEAANWLIHHAHDEYCLPPGKGGAYDDDDFSN